MIRYKITQSKLIFNYSHDISQVLQVLNEFNRLWVVPFHCMKNPPVLDDVLLLTFLWRVTTSFSVEDCSKHMAALNEVRNQHFSIKH